MKPRLQWTGLFRITNAETGEIVAENAILADGIELTMALWAGDTTEAFERFRLEDSNGDTVHEVDVDITYEVDESGSAPRGEMTSRALVSSSDMTDPVTDIAVLGTLGTIVARATLDQALEAGQAYEIKRIDYLAESDAVTP